METLRNFFHTDKWWGKTIFVILTYVVFWCVFYGSWLVIPYDSTVESNDDFIYIFLVYLFFIIPSASLFVVRFLRKTTFIKKLLIYFLNVILLILFHLSFIYIIVFSALSHWQIGGF